MKINKGNKSRIFLTLGKCVYVHTGYKGHDRNGILNVLVAGKSNETEHETFDHYRKNSGLSRTKSQSLNVSCIVLQLSSLNPLKPGVKLRMKM